MGYIYKIENNINHKIYIGQTIKFYEERFKQHKVNYTKEYFSQLALYKAFNKYGIENFTFLPIEEVANELLDEREKYWISFYDSYYNGYNSTLGGRLVELYEWDIDKIIERYMVLKSARKVAEEIGCDHSTIDRILNENKIKRFTLKEQRVYNNVVIENEKEKYSFIDNRECAIFLIEKGYTKSKNVDYISHAIREAIKQNKYYLGFKIYCESKIQSTPLVTED